MKKSSVTKLTALLFAGLILGTTPGSIALAADQNTSDSTSTLYIADGLKVATQSKGVIDSTDIISKENITKQVVEAYDHIVVDSTALDEEIQNVMQEAFEDGSKIFVLGNITTNGVRDYFGLDSVSDASGESTQITANISEGTIDDGNLVDVSQFPNVGKLIYQDQRGSNVTSVKSSNTSDSEAVRALINKCFDYDYLYSTTGMEKNSALASADSWTRVDVSSDTFDCDNRCVVSTSIRLEKYDGNPDSRGNYYFYVPFIVDVENDSTIKKVEVKTYGSPTSTIDDYGPVATNVGSGVNVSFSLPKGIGISFTPGPKTKITKVSGGIDNRDVTIGYQPLTAIGFNGYTQSDIRCDAHLESYQSGQLGAGYGQFHVYTYAVGTSPSGDYVDPITYYNSHPCTVN